MPLEPTLQDELQQEIASEIAAIRRQAEEQGETLLMEARNWTEERVCEAKRRLEEEVTLRSRQALTKAELEERNDLLRLKRHEVDQLFQQVGEQLADLRKEAGPAYRELMSRIYENCRRLLPEEALQVRLGPGLEGLGQELAGQAAMTVETDAQLFGLTLTTTNGRLRCDGSVPRLLTQIRREREADLEALLFGEDT